MDVDDFERWWRARDRADLLRLIAWVGAPASATGGDPCRARARAELDVALRRSGRHRLGHRVAHRLRVAALDACRRTGVLDDDHDGAVRLARAAGEAAQAMVCGRLAPCVDEVVGPFRWELDLYRSAVDLSHPAVGRAG